MAMDFPNAPTVGQLYPLPAVAGMPSYKWDGSAWQLAGAGMLPLAPIDGKMYGSKDGAWQRSVDDSGDTMTGPLILNADPTNVLGAATRQYVDAADTALTAADTTLTTAVNNRVRYDAAQVLTSPQLQQARKNIYAAPFDAMAFNGLQINGNMDVSQENGANWVALTGGSVWYIIDQWRAYAGTSSGVFAARQINPPAPIPASSQGFRNCLQMIATTPGAPAANDAFLILTHVEGWRAAALGFGSSNAQPVTIAFWIIANAAGTAALSIADSVNGRSYVTDIVVNAAFTWERKTVTIPGDVTGSAWGIANDVGLTMRLCLGVNGAGQIGTPNIWNSTLKVATASTTNFFLTTNNSVWLAGFGIWPGNEAPSAERSPYVMRPFDQEKFLAERQFFRIYGVSPYTPFGAGYAASNNSASVMLWYPREMRAVPTIAISNTGVNLPSQNPVTGINGANSGTRSSFLSLATSGLAVGQGLVWCCQGTPTGVVQGDARF